MFPLRHRRPRGGSARHPEGVPAGSAGRDPARPRRDLAGTAARPSVGSSSAGHPGNGARADGQVSPEKIAKLSAIEGLWTDRRGTWAPSSSLVTGLVRLVPSLQRLRRIRSGRLAGRRLWLPEFAPASPALCRGRSGTGRLPSVPAHLRLRRRRRRRSLGRSGVPAIPAGLLPLVAPRGFVPQSTPDGLPP